MDPGVRCDAAYGSPYPYATSVDPLTFHTYYPGPWQHTIYGGNLEGVILGVSWTWSFNGLQTGGPGWPIFNIISSSANHVTFEYGQFGDSEVCWYCGGKLWLEDPQTLTPCYIPIAVAP